MPMGNRILALFMGLVGMFYVQGEAFGGPLYGPPPSGSVPDGMVPGGNYSPPQPPSGSVPSLSGPGFNNNGNAGPSQNSSNPNGGPPPTPTGQGGVTSGPPQFSQGGNGGGTQTPSQAPTFMNGAMPNSSDQFLPSVVSPGLLSSPLENSYLQGGVPQLAAPLMSVVYQPFNSNYFQTNPFQVTPQGRFSLTGTFETDTNINYSPSSSQVGSLYTVMPAVYYTNFDDYGYISLLASGSYYSYLSGNVPSYLDEFGGITAGTYLGNKVFVGISDMGFNGSTPQVDGNPMGFLNGINSYYQNLLLGEVSVALTPKLTFIESASDSYYDESSFGAGIMNMQALGSTLKFTNRTTFLSASYNYSQAAFSIFPGFVSNSAQGTAMRSINPRTSIGVGGSASYYLYQNLPSLNMLMDSYYGILTHHLSRHGSFSIQGGWNGVSYYTGQTFQSPMVDFNLGYHDSRLGFGLNGGKFMENYASFGIEMGPEDVYMGLMYLSYNLGEKTSLYSSLGYFYYHFLTPANYASSFFQTLVPGVSYTGSNLTQTDGFNYRPLKWLQTSIHYSYLVFTTNIPNETIADNQFIVMMTILLPFR